MLRAYCTLPWRLCKEQRGLITMCIHINSARLWCEGVDPRLGIQNSYEPSLESRANLRWATLGWRLLPPS